MGTKRKTICIWSALLLAAAVFPGSARAEDSFHNPAPEYTESGTEQTRGFNSYVFEPGNELTVEALKKINADLQQQVESLRNENEQLKAELFELQHSEDADQVSRSIFGRGNLERFFRMLKELANQDAASFTEGGN